MIPAEAAATESPDKHFDTVIRAGHAEMKFKGNPTKELLDFADAQVKSTKVLTTGLAGGLITIPVLMTGLAI